MPAQHSAWTHPPSWPAAMTLCSIGRRGNPALLARSLLPAVSQLTGDEGARRILANPAVKVVEVEADADVVVDIDTPDALKDAQRQL